MLTRSRPLVLFSMFAVALVWIQTASAHDKAEGTFVQAKDGKLTLTTKGSDKQDTFDITKETAVTLDGKPAKLEDLKAGFALTLALGEKHVVNKIEALSKPKADAPKPDAPKPDAPKPDAPKKP